MGRSQVRDREERKRCPYSSAATHLISNCNFSVILFNVNLYIFWLNIVADIHVLSSIIVLPKFEHQDYATGVF